MSTTATSSLPLRWEKWTNVTPEQICDKEKKKAADRKSKHEFIYQQAYLLTKNGQYSYAIALLEDLIKRTEEVKIVQLLTFANLCFGTRSKSAYHLDRAHTLAASMLKTASLTDEVKAELIVYVANSFIELIGIMSYNKGPISFWEMVHSIDSQPLNVSEEQKAFLALSVGHVRVIAGQMLSFKEETRSLSSEQFARAFTLFSQALELTFVSPSTRCRLFYHLAKTHFLTDNLNASSTAFNLGLRIAEISCPELLEQYRSFNALIRQTLDRRP